MDIELKALRKHRAFKKECEGFTFFTGNVSNAQFTHWLSQHCAKLYQLPTLNYIVFYARREATSRDAITLRTYIEKTYGVTKQEFDDYVAFRSIPYNEIIPIPTKDTYTIRYVSTSTSSVLRITVGDIEKNYEVFTVDDCRQLLGTYLQSVYDCSIHKDVTRIRKELLEEALKG